MCRTIVRHLRSLIGRVGKETSEGKVDGEKDCRRNKEEVAPNI